MTTTATCVQNAISVCMLHEDDYVHTNHDVLTVDVLFGHVPHRKYVSPNWS